MSSIRRLWNVIRRARMDDDLRQELDTHLALIEEEERASGLSVEKARQSARLRFGSPLAYRERALDAVIASWLENAWQDVIVAARQLRGRPGFTLSVVLLLAMGIGLNAGMFAIINSVVLNALPLPDAGRLVAVTERTGTFETPASWPDFLDLRDGSHVLESAAAFTRTSGVVFRAAGDARNVGGSHVTREYFSTLGVQPLAGRIFDASEAKAGKSVVLLREDFWRAALNGDPAIVGKTVVLNGKVSDVIGVLPRSFRFPADDNVIWMPLLPEGLEADRGWHAFSMVGRLKPAITLSQAHDDLDAVMQRLAHDFPEKNAGHRASVRRLQEWSLDGGIRDRLIVLQVAALALCLVACANVSSLLLARYSARRLEFSIRAALGASRMRQMRQHVTESLLLTGLGCAAAVGFAWGAVRCLLWLYGARMPRAAEVSPDWRLVGVVAGIAMLVALGLGVVTALHQQSGERETSTRGSNRATAPLRAVLTRKILVVAQVSCAVVLLSVTGEVLQKFWSLLHVDIGIDRGQLVTMQVNLPSEKYRAAADVAGFFERVVDSARTLPGVVNAAAINMLPVAEWGFNGNVNVEGISPSDPAYRGFFAEYRWITPEYFRTMGIIVTRGRLFLSEEISGMQKAAIINESMAGRLWGQKDPLGARVRFLSPEWITVVGVVRDVRQTGVNVPPSPEIFLPASAYTGPFPTWSLVVRSPLPTESVLPALRRAVKHEEQDAAVDRVKTMDEVVIDSVANQRIVTSLLVSFAVLALAMAVLGIYSLVAYTVVARTPELAIRAALGSSPAALIRLVGRQGLALVAIGLALGAAATIPVSAALAASLFGVSRIGAPVFAGVIVTLFTAGGLATLVPAAQTARIDPLRALRQE
jgi:putative ABC transport system permease protein